MKRLVVFAILINMFAWPAGAFRYICNGFLANGEERHDECGVCDEANAARWSNPNLPVIVDYSVRPNGLSLADWRGVVSNSFAAWDGISGSDLRFFEVEGQNRREFGSNDGAHELFWITDKDEWRRLVGSGEFGTLGATLPRYFCGGDLGSKRLIFDADLVLNGLPHINWQVECNNDDCISIQTTLVHELGHFFGLDHPCLLCSSSVMSARAGFDISNPLLDDMEGLRSLYPGNNTGGFGYACSNDTQCSEGFYCLQDGANSYCTKKCTSQNDCDGGSICEIIIGQSFCVFSNGESSGGLLEGEDCSKRPCNEAFVCAGVMDSKYSCFKACQNEDSCLSGQSCVSVPDDDINICVNIKKKGEVCNSRDLCAQGYVCIFSSTDSGFCRAECGDGSDNSVKCLLNEECRLLDSGRQACVPAAPGLDLDGVSNDFGTVPGGGNLGRDKTENNGSGDSGVNSSCSANIGAKKPDLPWFSLGLLLLAIWRKSLFLRNFKKKLPVA